MRLPMYQVDAFTSEVFCGNPAAVCPLEAWLPDPVMQSIAAENNLSETAFFVRDGDTYHLRWFTPTVEVSLCGHATLASAFVLFNMLGVDSDNIEFRSKSGPLFVNRRDDRLELDFPSCPPRPCKTPSGLVEALGDRPADVLICTETTGGGNLVAVFETESEVRKLSPNFGAMRGLNNHGVIATAVGDAVDFVSRYFAPAFGVNEDPVTGSAHCTLTPLWADRLGKRDLHARQISKRGGELHCRLVDKRVMIAGHAVLYLKGEIHLPKK